MKKIVLLSFLFCSIALFSQNEYSYYYKNTKQNLSLNTKYAYISGENVDIQHLLSDNISNIESVDSTNYANDYVIVEFLDVLSKERYFARLKEFSRIYNVYAEPFFSNCFFDKIGASKYFYVRLRKIEDTTILSNYAREFKSQVVLQDEYMPLWFTLRKDNTSRYNSVELSKIFYKSGLFSTAEPDLIVNALLSNDSLYSLQWNLNNTGQYNTEYYCNAPGVDIDVEKAWNITNGDTNVKIALIDDGLYLSHPDLIDNMYYKSYDTENNDTVSRMYGSHGTACAGIIGAIQNNEIGLSGISTQCRLMSISAKMNSSEINEHNIAKGINWAWRNNASIINCSWHYYPSEYISDAIDSAVLLGRNEKGCVVVCASGNKDLDTVNFPANMTNTISVGAISIDGNRKTSESCDRVSSWGSQYGTNLSIVAPGILYLRRQA